MRRDSSRSHGARHALQPNEPPAEQCRNTTHATSYRRVIRSWLDDRQRAKVDIISERDPDGARKVRGAR